METKSITIKYKKSNPDAAPTFELQQEGFKNVGEIINALYFMADSLRSHLKEFDNPDLDWNKIYVECTTKNS